MRYFASFFGVVAVATWLASGCANEEKMGDSETHFLEPCTLSCEGELRCIENVCTKPCAEDADCADLGDSATCHGNSASEATGVCDVACAGPAECSALGARFECIADRCRVEGDGSPGEDGGPSDGSASEGDGTAHEAAVPGVDGGLRESSSGDGDSAVRDASAPLGEGGIAMCPAGALRQGDSWGAPRSMNPWVLEPADNGVPDSGAGPGGDAQAPGTSGCGPIPEVAVADGERCTGAATVANQGGDLRLLLRDGSVFVWTPDAVSFAIRPPAVRDGDTVWVEHEREVRFACPFCGTYTNVEMVIRAAEGGSILFVAQAGHRLDEVSSELTDELFGVPATRQLECASVTVDECERVERDRYEITLQTSPPQTLKHAELRAVSSPVGRYDVAWAAGSLDIQLIDASKCASDGPFWVADRGFVASRLDAAE